MNAVLEKTRATTSAASEDNSASIANDHQNIDRHVVSVAKQVAQLIQPITVAWSMPGSFPGQDQLVEADDLLLHLIDPSYEWDQDRPKPSAAGLMAEVQDWLEQSLNAIDTRDALDGHEARRLLTREALTRAKAACHWCIDAHARVDAEAAPPAAPAPAVETQPCRAITVCEGIALQASILLKLVDSASANPDTNDLHDALDAIRIIVASIGSLADGFNDESMRGNQYGWHLGEDMKGGSDA